MYVCLEVALCGVPMERGVQLGLAEGPIKSGSNVPTQPRGTTDTESRTLDHTHGHTCVF